MGGRRCHVCEVVDFDPRIFALVSVLIIHHHRQQRAVGVKAPVFKPVTRLLQCKHSNPSYAELACVMFTLTLELPLCLMCALALVVTIL
jgi:hypothetical protein